MAFANTCTSADAQKLACYQHSGHSTPFACLGARCMAWRWDSHEGKESLGFCGMAGRPDSPSDELMKKWPDYERIIRETLR